MAEAAVSLRSSELKEPSVLFERYSTEDIRRIERRVRGDIEQKKEELRQMVGERYRDLIDAADTIRDMRQSSESVLRAVSDMGRYCSALKLHGSCLSDSSQHRGSSPWQPQFYSAAAQIALLLDIPEQVWSALEGGQYLRATQLYLLSTHLHSQLQLQPSSGISSGACYSPVLARFPILVRQLATTGQFRSSILVDSRSVLRGRAVSDQAIAEALVSCMLLEGSSPRQALTDFLLARKASIQELLTQPQHGAGIKAQVCSLVELLVTTLFQAYAVFYLPPEGSPRSAEGPLSCGLLFSTIQSVTAPTTPGETRSILHNHSSAARWSKHLPPSIRQFQPTLRTLAQPIQQSHLRDTLQQWIHTCQEDVGTGVASLLVYVKSLKALASIRDAVWELLSSDSISQHWDTVCNSLLERPLLLWEHFLEQLFLQRLQAITKEETVCISSSCTQMLSSTLAELEGLSGGPGAQMEADVASFLWSESAGDLPSDAGWVSVSQRGQQQRSGLAMKTQALTPCVQNVCSNLDSQLKARLEDLQHYLPSQSSESNTGAPVQRQDCPAEEALRVGSVACVRHILSYIHSQLQKPQDQPRPDQLAPVLFMARLCQSIAELCPNLKQCILGKQADSQPTPKGTPRQSRAPRGRAVEASPSQAQWALIKEELLSCTMEAYRIWSSALSTVLLNRFGTALYTQSPGLVLSTATCWEDLQIQEESESGSSVTSTIRLPAQPSWFVQALLFGLCVEVNRVGGQAVPRATLQELLEICLSLALQHYSRLTQPDPQTDGAFPMTQNRALQLLFDLRYLSSTLGVRVDEGRPQAQQDPRVQDVCDWLEGFIDPFDLDVFTPHMNANLSRLSQRTSVLLGLLTGLEKQYSARSLVHSHESSIILPLASTHIRFGLLPLSSSSARRSQSTRGAPTPQSLVLAAPASTVVGEDPYRPGSAFKQLAQQQEEDSAASSLFRLGWLSGISK